MRKINSPKSEDKIVIFAQKLALQEILTIFLKVREIGIISETRREMIVFVKNLKEN